MLQNPLIKLEGSPMGTSQRNDGDNKETPDTKASTAFLKDCNSNKAV